MGKTLSVVFFGPVLGSMDSNEQPTGLACTDNGVVVTMSIEHRGDSAQKNILWRPRVEVELSLHQQQVVVEGKWIMRDSNGGGEVYLTNGWRVGPLQKFPVTIEKTIDAAFP
jgi:hypothetical protein